MTAARALAPLTIVPATLADNVAELRGTRLYVDTASPVEDQLAAIADAVEVLRGGRATWGRTVRRLRLVTS